VATMTLQDQTRCMNQFMRARNPTGAFVKADLLAAVQATDSWIDTNAAAFNSALPTAVRNGMTSAQKTELFCYVAMRRAGLLHAEEDG
jgi:hypothetical protein